MRSKVFIKNRKKNTVEMLFLILSHNDMLLS